MRGGRRALPRSPPKPTPSLPESLLRVALLVRLPGGYLRFSSLPLLPLDAFPALEIKYVRIRGIGCDHVAENEVLIVKHAGGQGTRHFADAALELDVESRMQKE